MLLNCGVGEDPWESLGLQGDPTSPSERRSVLRVHWKDWCWSGNSNILATWCKELTHWKRPWCCEGLRAGGEGDERRWDGWMPSPPGWIWLWVDSGSWWWIGRPGVLLFVGLERAGHDWTELNWKVGKLINFKHNHARRKKPDSDTCWIKPCNCYRFMLYKHIKVGKKSRKNSCFYFYKQQTFLLFHLQLFHILIKNSTIITSYPHTGIGTKWGRAVSFTDWRGKQTTVFIHGFYV